MIMNFTFNTAETFIPDGKTLTDALAGTTHLGIGAHQDDLEFMAFHGVLACYQQSDLGFSGVTCTNGSGSARSGEFASFTDEEMQAIRKKEQNTAAEIGEYSAVMQLDFPSSVIKDPNNESLEEDLIKILKASRPEIVYTHNPADKHDTHIAVFHSTLRALRSLPKEERPKQVIGCEVWRGLDWMLDSDKVAMNVSGNDELAEKLNGVFASQIAGGKRYDLATIGRRRANATFFESHGVDEVNHLWFGMDLTPLIEDDTLDIRGYVNSFVTRFAEDVTNKLSKQMGR